MSTVQTLKGFSDLFPPESTRFSTLEKAARSTFERFGFAEVRIPVVEHTELFARSIGDETDIVRKEMYTFTDKGGRSVTLRPEATAGVVRAFIQAKLFGQGRSGPVKLYTFGPMFRYERPQKGRLRQFHQINAEVFGSSSPYCDAEVVFMLWDFLSGLALPDLRLQLNSLGCPACRPSFLARLREFLAGVRDADLCEDCLRRREANPLRVLDCKVPGCITATEGAPTLPDSLCPECADHFRTVLDVVSRADIPYVINPRLVRGLDYYQRTTFEVVSTSIGAQSSVAGGGRYDGLVEQLGGPPVPGIGFACGMERLALLLQDDAQRGLDFYLAVLDDSAVPVGLLLARTLRDKGFRGEVGFEVGSVKSRMRQANRLGARTCLLLGSEEIARNQIQVKDMSTGVQKTVPQEDILHAIGLVPTGGN